MQSAFFFVLYLLIAWANPQPLPAGSVTADFGQDAVLQWQLPGAVAQVVVQKRTTTTGDLEIVATFSRKFGQAIADAYTGRVEWRAADLFNPSIRIHNVTWSDEACYICTFHVYSTGSHDQTTCLTVQGISNVNTDVEITQHNEVLVSCSATGKPTPQISWRASGINNSTETASHRTVSSADGMFTVSSNLSLVPPILLRSVDCVVHGGSAGPWRETISLPILRAEVHTEAGEQGKTNHAGTTAGIVVTVIIVLLFIATVALQRANKLQPLIQKNIDYSSLTTCSCRKTTSRRDKRSGGEKAEAYIFRVCS